MYQTSSYFYLRPSHIMPFSRMSYYKTMLEKAFFALQYLQPGSASAELQTPASKSMFCTGRNPTGAEVLLQGKVASVLRRNTSFQQYWCNNWNKLLPIQTGPYRWINFLFIKPKTGNPIQKKNFCLRINFVVSFPDNTTNFEEQRNPATFLTQMIPISRHEASHRNTFSNWVSVLR